MRTVGVVMYLVNSIGGVGEWIEFTFKRSAKEAEGLFGSVKACCVVHDPASMVSESEERVASGEIEEFIQSFDIWPSASGFMLDR